MSDLPPGEWAEILVGAQWPNLLSLNALSGSAESRNQLSAAFVDYSELLDRINKVELVQQDGFTAEDARGVFTIGITSSSHIARVNLVKRDAYITIYDKVSELRHSLSNLAEEGSARINAINNSKKPLPVKINEILHIVGEIRERSFHRSVECGGQISDQIRVLLSAQGFDKSPQSIAAEHGVTPSTRASADLDELRAEIGKLLDLSSGVANDSQPESTPARPTISHDGAHSAPVSSPTSIELAAGGATTDTKLPSVDPSGRMPPTTAAIVERAETAASPVGSSPVSRPPPTTTIGDSGLTNGVKPAGIPGQPPVSTTAIADGAASPISTAGGAALRQTALDAANAPPLTPATTATAASPRVDSLSAAATPSAGNSTMPTGPAPLNPNELAGTQSNAPVSLAAEAIATAAASPVHTAPPPLNTPLETIAPAPPIFETAHTVAASGPDIPPAGPVSAEVVPPALAPTPTAAVVPSAPPPISAGPVVLPGTTPPSGLLAYGADLRPPTIAAAAAPPLPLAAPGSAPVNPTGGATPTGQPTVVRQQPSGATPLAAAPGLVERAMAATTAGAVVGATAGRSAAESRLRRLLAAVARQQPQLRWAIGDLDNGDTVLATDLAGGWIPPQIAIPAGVKLLQPAERQKTLAALLGATTLTATYEPGQYLPPEDQPVAMSIRPRDTAAVEDLGWALSQATKWRDGLPRLAHTLAKAVSAKTGYLDSEVVLLREHLDAVMRSALKKYPATVNPTEVGNWQLLATIDALIDDAKGLANYHFAWFHAQAQTWGGRR